MTDMIKLLQAQTELKIQAANIQRQIETIPFYQDIVSVLNSSDYFTAQADQLVDLIIQRDEPAGYNDIAEAFKSSGFEYGEYHILRCNPDSAETIQKQVDYYRE